MNRGEIWAELSRWNITAMMEKAEYLKIQQD